MAGHNQGPKLPQRNLDGQWAEDLVSAIVHRMGHVWRPPGLDSGLDGYIELRDQRTEEPIGRYIGVQVKARSAFQAETPESFEFRCDEKAVNGWMRSEVPVLLVLVHIPTGEMWFKSVTDWFAIPSVRDSRTVVLRKAEERFDSELTGAMLRLGLRNEPVAARLDVPAPEALVSNLLPIAPPPERIWCAATSLRTYGEARARYEQRGGSRASDYILRDGCLYSFRHPSSCELGVLCDTDSATSFPFTDWARSSDRSVRRNLAELLKRALLQQVKRTIGWNPARNLFYFRSYAPHRDIKTVGPSGPRLAIKVKEYTKDGERKIAWIRHQAFRATFLPLGGEWYLAITPDYLYTFDGERETSDAPQLLAGLKTKEKQAAVYGHLKMWEHVLLPAPSLLEEDAPILSFGPLASVGVPRGIDDDDWRVTSDDESTEQGQLVA